MKVRPRRVAAYLLLAYGLLTALDAPLRYGGSDYALGSAVGRLLVTVIVVLLLVKTVRVGWWLAIVYIGVHSLGNLIEYFSQVPPGATLAKVIVAIGLLAAALFFLLKSERRESPANADRSET